MRRLGLAGLFAILLMGCGIPVDSEPEVFDLDLVIPAEDDAPLLGDLVAVSMYLVRNETLVQVTRDLPSPPDPQRILASLFDGATEPEVRANLRTSIPPGTRVISVSAEEPLLRVDLSQEFAAVGGEEEILAVAQIVLTATSIEGIESVAFELDGLTTAVPLPDGALSIDPVSADDYAALIAP